MSKSGTAASVVLVHGAWADGSSWSSVIRPLQSRGLDVFAAPIPLWPGANLVTVVSRENNNVRTAYPLYLYRADGVTTASKAPR